jgi:hypothetical protein
VASNNRIKDVNLFNYVGYTIAVSDNGNLEIEVNRFKQMCSTVLRTLIIQMRKERQIMFYKTIVVPTFVY